MEEKNEVTGQNGMNHWPPATEYDCYFAVIVRTSHALTWAPAQLSATTTVRAASRCDNVLLALAVLFISMCPFLISSHNSLPS